MDFIVSAIGLLQYDIGEISEILAAPPDGSPTALSIVRRLIDKLPAGVVPEEFVMELQAQEGVIKKRVDEAVMGKLDWASAAEHPRNGNSVVLQRYLKHKSEHYKVDRIQYNWMEAIYYAVFAMHLYNHLLGARWYNNEYNIVTSPGDLLAKGYFGSEYRPEKSLSEVKWRRLFQFRNLVRLVYIVCPHKGQTNMVLRAAGLLHEYKLLTPGGGAGYIVRLQINIVKREAYLFNLEIPICRDRKESRAVHRAVASYTLFIDPNLAFLECDGAES